MSYQLNTTHHVVRHIINQKSQFNDLIDCQPPYVISKYFSLLNTDFQCKKYEKKPLYTFQETKSKYTDSYAGKFVNLVRLTEMIDGKIRSFIKVTS